MTAASSWCKRLLNSGLAAVLCSAAGMQAAQAITIELKDVAPYRIERQRQHAAGTLSLPGTPDVRQLAQRLSSKGLHEGAEVFIRIFKAESELELWMRKGDRFVLLDTYPMCHWSGTLGPKLAEGDKQNPEGFYKIRRRHLHLAGRWPRSLNLGFPNPFDKAQLRTGSYILLHGGCSSTGCFAMTDPVMQEIYGLTEKAMRGGQQIVNVHVFPFRMTDANMALHAQSEWRDFWANLKEGYDAFETTQVPPRVMVCDERYIVQERSPGEVTAASQAQPEPRRGRRGRLDSAQDYACVKQVSEAVETAEPAAEDAGQSARETVRGHGFRSISQSPTETSPARTTRRQSTATATQSSGFAAEAFFYRR